MSSVRIIKRTKLREYSNLHGSAKQPLEDWHKLTKAAEWTNLVDTKKTFPQADQVKVASKRVTTIFNIGGNKFRLITAIHYKAKIVFLLCFLTHSEYDKNTWKNQL